jgi:hypothetical protein
VPEQRFIAMFRTEPEASDTVQNALSAAGIELAGSHGEPRSLPPGGGDLPEPNTHTAVVDADGEDEARRKVTEAVQGKTAAFELLSVAPAGEGHRVDP